MRYSTVCPVKKLDNTVDPAIIGSAALFASLASQPATYMPYSHTCKGVMISPLSILIPCIRVSTIISNTQSVLKCHHLIFRYSSLWLVLVRNFLWRMHISLMSSKFCRTYSLFFSYITKSCKCCSTVSRFSLDYSNALALHNYFCGIHVFSISPVQNHSGRSK